MSEKNNNAMLSTVEKTKFSDIGQTKVKDHIPDELSVEEVIRFIHSNVEAWKEMQTYYYCAMMEVETKFKVLNQEFSLSYDRNPIESIKTRMKSPESLAQKLIRKKLPLNLPSLENNIFDMAGVRIVCSFIDDIYLLADSFSKQDDVFVLETNDYIKSPKPSGYRGLHLVIEIPIFLHDEKRPMKVEVQFRTMAMDFWASLEHKLRYKKNLNPAVLADVESKLSQCSQSVFNLDRDMQDIRNRIDEFNSPTE